MININHIATFNMLKLTIKLSKSNRKKEALKYISEIYAELALRYQQDPADHPGGGMHVNGRSSQS